MAIRAHLDTLPQPFRWLAACQSTWAALAAAASRLRRRSRGVDVSPVSNDWLLDLERQTIKRLDL